MMRANVGCGTQMPDGWDNFDIMGAEAYFWDVRCPMDSWNLNQNDGKHPVTNRYDYVVSSFALQELDFHELPKALDNLYAILKPGGALRILVPNVMLPFKALLEHNEKWFPQDERSGGLDGKFCSYVTWFGTVRSVFTAGYLTELFCKGQWSRIGPSVYGDTRTAYPGIVELDSRPKEALVFEALK